MKLNYYSIIFFLGLLAFNVEAQQVTNVEKGLKFFEEKIVEWGLEKDDIKDLLVSDMYQTKHNGVTHVYFNQAYNGIPIYNAITNLNITKDGKIFNVGHRFISNVASRVNTDTPEITPDVAIQKAGQQLGIKDAERPTMLRSGDDKLIFAQTSFTNSDIPAKLKYQLTEDGSLKLVWDVALDMKHNADYLSVRVDAVTGELIGNHNWTVYCAHDKNKYTNHNHNCGINTLNKVNNSFTSAEKAAAGAAPINSYRVYALPAESPNHGPHVLVEDPFDPIASPLGWHDTDGEEGPEYTITRGNNTHAYADIDDNNASIGDEPDAGPSLVFDFPHDADGDPFDSKDAAIVNLFYANNMLHDITYRFGFDEASGNFQANNYGNGGLGGDHVNAEGFDGSGTNNANFATPDDGGNGRMQMYLWDNPGGLLSVDRPDEISGFITELGTGNFGADVQAENISITADIAIAIDATLQTPTQCCEEIVNSADIAGKVALIDRGECDFSLKVYNGQQAGAVAVLICNIAGVNGGTGEEITNMAAGDRAGDVTIPSFFLKKSDCDKMRVSITNGVPVTVTIEERESVGPTQFDASFDNNVIAHEYGHGISNRLTGGPSNSGCLNGAEQMGEGWSDFFALAMTVEPGDQGSDSRGIGTYVDAQPITGGGIRRFPYSTDMSINPQTYDDIKTGSVPHGVGEIWADCIWDLYWKMVEVYGYDADLNNTESGNFKAIQLVMDGMKWQPCNPGFVDGRDAIIQADFVNYGGENHCLIWEVFARRGVGYNANQGSVDDNGDGVENFEPLPTCLEELKITKAVDKLINAGDEVTVTLNAINHIPAKQEGVIITDELPSGLTYIEGSSSGVEPMVSGNTLIFEIGDMEYEDELTITYRAISSVNNQTVRTYFDDMESGFGEWNLEFMDDGFVFWGLVDISPYSGYTSWYITEGDAEMDQALISPRVEALGNSPALRFYHKFDTSPADNGGFLQVSTDGGTLWETIRTEDFIRNPYSGALGYSTFAIPSLDAFSGTTNDQYIDSYVDLSKYAGESINIRFRFGRDENGGASEALLPGWFIDDFEMLDIYKYTSTACIGTAADPEQRCTDPVETIVDSGVVPNKNVEADYFDLRFFPNPASKILTVGIISKTDEEALISLSTMEGKKVMEQKVDVNTSENLVTLDVENYPAGMYLVKVSTGANSTTRKVVIK